MSNNGNIGSDVVADKIANVLLTPAEEMITYADRYSEKIADKNPQITGQYRSEKKQLIRIEMEDGKTYYKRGSSKIELTKENEYTYFPNYDPNEKLVFYDDKFVFYDTDGSSKNYKRINEEPASLKDLKAFEGSYFSNELDMSLKLWLSENKTLKIKFSTKPDVRDVEVLNRNELLSRNFTLQVERDAFDRPTDLLVSLGRALNNRFKKTTNLEFQNEISTENGSIQVNTIASKTGEGSKILVTKNLPNGNEEWFKVFGGNSYDKASSILSTEDGYLITGSTSSYGVGNYDILIIKTDKKGKKLWQKTFGKFFNDYGYTTEKIKNGFLIKGTSQTCDGNTDINRKCENRVLFIKIDKNGNEVESQLGEIYIK